MIARRVSRFALPILALLVTAAHAQTTHTFSFGPLQNGSAPFTLIDGNDPNEGIGYSGSIQVRNEGENPYWGMQAPAGPFENPDGSFCTVGGIGVCSWGFPNNGGLTQNTVTPEPGQLIWDNPGCNDRTVGCTSYRRTTIPFVGYGAGVTVNVTVHYIVTHGKCTRYCDNDSDDYVWYNNSTGGTGTATYQPQ